MSSAGRGQGRWLLAGGLLGRVRNGDIIRLDAVAGTLSALVDPAEWERREVATHLIDNGGDLESLARQVDAVWADLLTREPPPEPAEKAPVEMEPE